MYTRAVIRADSPGRLETEESGSNNYYWRKKKKIRTRTKPRERGRERKFKTVVFVNMRLWRKMILASQTRATATPTETTSFWSLITMWTGGRLLIERYWLLTARSITWINWWVFLLWIAWVHNFTETILLHFFDLTDKTLCEPEKDVSSWKKQYWIGGCWRNWWWWWWWCCWWWT